MAIPYNLQEIVMLSREQKDALRDLAYALHTTKAAIMRAALDAEIARLRGHNANG